MHQPNLTKTPPTPATTAVPLVDLRLQHQRIAETVARGFEEVMETASFVLGPQVEKFEEEYAHFCGVQHCIGVGSGTDAIELALRGAGIGPGDDVIVPANTFVATAEAVRRCGASVVLADCADDYLLDPASVADRLTARTRAVVGVDLYGQIARFEELSAVVGDSVLLVEDAAQSQGATRNGRASGAFGSVAATSFYPGKNLGAYGDGGAVLTDDPEIARRVRELRNHGGLRRYEHNLVGTTSRLDSLQATVLSAKLAVLPEWNAEREVAAETYGRLLAGVEGVVLPVAISGNRHVWHLFVVRVPDRDRVLTDLNRARIGAGIHYPAPVHLLPAFADLGHGIGDFPTAERLAGEILSLPIYPGITMEQQEAVVHALCGALAQRHFRRRNG